MTREPDDGAGWFWWIAILSLLAIAARLAFRHFAGR
jgi:hypothetical protein